LSVSSQIQISKTHKCVHFDGLMLESQVRGIFLRRRCTRCVYFFIR